MTIERAIREDAHDVDQGMEGVDEFFDDTEKAFLDAEFEDGESLSETGEEEADVAEEEDPSEDDVTEQDRSEDPDSEDDASDDAPEDKTPKAKIAEDDAEIVTTVDGKEVRATVKDVRRLLGQEAKLTQRSMQVADKDRSVDAQLDWLKGTLGPLAKAAEARWAEYKDANLYLAAQEMDRATFKVFQADYEQAKADYGYVQGLQAKIAQGSAARQQEAYNEAVKAVHAAVNDAESTVHIPGWSQELYGSLLNYAENELKLDPRAIDKGTDPVVFKLLHLLKTEAEAKAKVKSLRDKAKGAKPAVPTTTRVKVTAPGAQSALKKKGEVDSSAEARLKKTGRGRDADRVFEQFVD